MDNKQLITRPKCEQKLAKATDNARCDGMYVKCKNCREEVETVMPNHLTPESCGRAMSNIVRQMVAIL